MRLEKLTLYSFRNYETFESEFVPGVNLIVGDNAQGKTNLLEAITYLSTGRSFRTRKEQELIRFGDDFCDLQARVEGKDRCQTIRAVMFQGRRQRQLFIGGVKQKKAAALQGLMPTVLFCPEDLMILKTGAAGRRKLIDTALCQLRPNYDTALGEYTRLLEHKSRILKDWHEMPSLLDTLPDFNEQMARYGALVIHTRAKYLRELEKQAGRYHGEFSGGREALTVEYQTVSNIEDPFAPMEELYGKLREHQKSHYRAEVESGQCLSGPHKDDFSACLGGLPIKSYGSQGQTRTAAISLKLAERELFRLDTGEEPILLLDDVLSELDAGRQNFVLNEIRSGQVFITCCEKDRLTDIGQVITIEGGSLIK
ncbi:MAG: DNA replication/repair protein RecF [Oscillospiraceae bacterium]|nr:DNA replication/repair protein RecF [Oscillospiraceae bacterium]